MLPAGASRRLSANQEGLTLVEPIAKALDAQGKPGDASVRPVTTSEPWPRSINAQKTSDYHKKARHLCEMLVARNLDTPKIALRWPRFTPGTAIGRKPRNISRPLDRAEKTRDPLVVDRKPEYLAACILELIRGYQATKEPQDLARASELLEKLKGLPHDASRFIGLQVQLYMAATRSRRLETCLRARPTLHHAREDVGTCRLSEELGQIDLAEQMIRESGRPGRRALVPAESIEFLGRHGRVKDGVDLCSQCGKRPPIRRRVLRTQLLSLFAPPPGNTRCPGEARCRLVRRGLKKHPNSSNLIVGLGNLRELQGRYDEAELLYRRGIAQGRGSEIALNNLAWLMALQRRNLPEALDLINRVIGARGPLSELLDTRGGVYLASGDSQNAIKDFEEAVAQNPTSPKYFHLAQAYLKAGNKTAAAQVAEECESKGTDGRSPPSPGGRFLPPDPHQAGDTVNCGSGVAELGPPGSTRAGNARSHWAAFQRGAQPGPRR